MKNKSKFWQNKPNYKITNTAKHEIRHQYLSANKVHRILKWFPQYNLESGHEIWMAGAI